MIVKAKFKPREDITAYELAVIVKEVRGGVGLPLVLFTEDQWEELPEMVRRHFKRVELSRKEDPSVETAGDEEMDGPYLGPPHQI